MEFRARLQIVFPIVSEHLLNLVESNNCEMKSERHGVEKSAGRVERMFAQIAPHYDRMNHLLSLGIDRRWRRATVDRIAPLVGAATLDVCTGTGDLAFELAQRTDCPRIEATDFCEPMLSIARRKQTTAGIAPDRVRFSSADAMRLPFADEEFDLVTVAFGLRNVQDTAAGLREMLRVCRPGGNVAILEFSRPTLWGLRHGYNWYFQHVLPRIGQRLAKNDSDAYGYLPASVAAFPSGEAMLQLMRQCGYVDVEQTAYTFGVASLYLGQRPRSET